MQRIIALGLIVGLLGSGCALPRATPATFSIEHAQAAAIRQSVESRDADDWRKYIEQLPSGTAIRIGLADGTRLKAILVGIEQGTVIVQPETRLPEPRRRIPLQAIVSLSIESGGINVGKAIAIGVGTGAASFVALFLIVMNLLAD
jgi:hypothetical protein